MDMLGIFKNIQKILIILISLWDGLFIGAVNESWIEICQTKIKTGAEELHIKSPGFPKAWTDHTKCQCDIDGHGITIATRTLVSSGEAVLEVVHHDDQGNKNSWPRDNGETSFDKHDRNLVIARNATTIKVSIDTSATRRPTNTVILFMFDFQATEEMTVSCQNMTSSNMEEIHEMFTTTQKTDKPTHTTKVKHTPTHASKKEDTSTNITQGEHTPTNASTTEKTPVDLLEQIGSVCSPHFVIILGALCCALLLIILIVSIILCCVTPRRRIKYTIDYRNQQVTDEKKLRKAEKHVRESIIYDKAEVNLRASAAFNNTFNNTAYATEGQHGYSNTGSQLLQRTTSVPAHCATRQSAQYANSVVAP